MFIIVAWYEWGEDNGYCHYEKDGFLPERGDILIYNNILSKDNKPHNSICYDHIGIVLSVDGEYLTVAEGNDGNRNVSAILTRKHDEKIGCYLRIPANYTYDGWKINFKTGEVRVESLETK